MINSTVIERVIKGLNKLIPEVKDLGDVGIGDAVDFINALAKLSEFKRKITTALIANYFCLSRSDIQGLADGSNNSYMAYMKIGFTNGVAWLLSGARSYSYEEEKLRNQKEIILLEAIKHSIYSQVNEMANGYHLDDESKRLYACGMTQQDFKNNIVLKFLSSNRLGDLSSLKIDCGLVEKLDDLPNWPKSIIGHKYAALLNDLYQNIKSFLSMNGLDIKSASTTDIQHYGKSAAKLLSLFSNSPLRMLQHFNERRSSVAVKPQGYWEIDANIIKAIREDLQDNGATIDNLPDITTKHMRRVTTNVLNVLSKRNISYAQFCVANFPDKLWNVFEFAGGVPDGYWFHGASLNDKHIRNALLWLIKKEFGETYRDRVYSLLPLLRQEIFKTHKLSSLSYLIDKQNNVAYRLKEIILAGFPELKGTEIEAKLSRSQTRNSEYFWHLFSYASNQLPLTITHEFEVRCCKGYSCASYLRDDIKISINLGCGIMDVYIEVQGPQHRDINNRLHRNVVNIPTLFKNDAIKLHHHFTDGKVLLYIKTEDLYDKNIFLPILDQIDNYIDFLEGSIFISDVNSYLIKHGYVSSKISDLLNVPGLFGKSELNKLVVERPIHLSQCKFDNSCREKLLELREVVMALLNKSKAG